MTDPAAPRRLFLARHGRTRLNAEGRLRGRADPPLDEVGEDEARRLGRALAGRGIALVASSPLARAAATGRAVAAACGVPWLADDRFDDRDYGPWTGERRSEVVARWGSVDAAPGVEPAGEVLARARPALDALLAEHPDGALAVVTHDAVLRPLVAAIDAAVRLEAPTGSWSELMREDGRWRVEAVDLRPGPWSE